MKDKAREKERWYAARHEDRRVTISELSKIAEGRVIPLEDAVKVLPILPEWDEFTLR